MSDVVLKFETVTPDSNIIVVAAFVKTAVFYELAQIPQNGSTLQDFPGIILKGNANFGTYTLSKIEPVGRGQDDLFTKIWFIPPYDAATMSKPYQKLPSADDHFWDQVITGVKVNKDRHFTASTNGISGGVHGIITRPTYTVQLFGLPPTTRGSLIYEWKYLSSQMFKIGLPSVPVPRMMDINIGGNRTLVESSLHGDINIPGNEATIDSSYNGVSGGGGGRTPGFRARRTGDFPTREPYFFAAKQVQLENGMFDMRRYLAIPPESPKPERIR